jgi:ABC-2 type transport system ATP-binding protein
VNALEIRGLSHGFGRVQALRDVSLTVAAGSFAVLLGPNGAGKTTLVSLVAGLYRARAGEIAVLGHSVRREPLAALAGLGVVFQTPSLDLGLTVRENLLYHAALHGLSGADARDRIAAGLARLGLGDRTNARARALSGGMRRRVEIVRALLHRPRLIVLDEPTAGLDAASRRSILADLRAACREEGLAVLFATHLLDEVDSDDPAIVLREGAVVWTGAARDMPAAAGMATVPDAFLALTGAA